MRKIIASALACVMLVAVAAPAALQAQPNPGQTKMKKIPMALKCVSEETFVRHFGKNLKVIVEHNRRHDENRTATKRVVIDPNGRVIVYILLDAPGVALPYCVMDMWPQSQGIVEPPAPGDDV